MATRFRIDVVTAGVVVLGAVLVLAALVADVGWPSVLLELGAGLFLVAVLYYVELRIERRTKEAQADLTEEVRGTVEEVRQEVAQQVAEFREEVSLSAQRFFAARDARHDEMFEAFRAEPSIATLVPIVDRLTELKLSQAGQVPLTDICALNFAPTPGDRQRPSALQLKLLQYKTGANLPTHDPAMLTWTADDDYDDVVALLGDYWARTGMYPGDDQFARLDLVDIIATQYRSRIDSAFVPDDETADRAQDP